MKVYVEYWWQPFKQFGRSVTVGGDVACGVHVIQTWPLTGVTSKLYVSLRHVL